MGPLPSRRFARSSPHLRAGIAVLALLVAGCGAGPSQRPEIAVKQHSAGTATTSAKKPVIPGPPPLAVPKEDLTWTDCTDDEIKIHGYGAGPQGLLLECATYPVHLEVDDAQSPQIDLGAVRARLPQTPKDAAPIVVSSGSDRTSIDTLVAIATGPVSTLLASHPLVAVDRRGGGESANNRCIDPQIARQIKDGAQFRNSAVPVTDQMTFLSQQATTKCKDLLQPHELTHDSTHAADDIEQLRKLWKVDTIAFVGLGNGARVGLAYAAQFPTHLSRLILDSPEPFGTDAVTVAESRAAGLEAAVNAFSTRCKAIRCVLGADPRGTITELLTKARNNQLEGISVKSVITALVGFLGSPAGDLPNRTADFAQTLESANNGDLTALKAAIAREETINETDGQFMMRCSDSQQAPPGVTVNDLMNQWAKKYPIGGREIALDMLACAAWPTPPAIPAIKDLRLPVLVINSVADPVAGQAGSPTVTGAIANGGGTTAELTWHGSGHPVLAHSQCAQQAAVSYLDTGKLPPNGGVCPA